MNHVYLKDLHLARSSAFSIGVIILSTVRKAAKFAVYEATMIIAKPAQTIPNTRAEKLLGVPSPIPISREVT